MMPDTVNRNQDARNSSFSWKIWSERIQEARQKAAQARPL